jgi:hypothetical protein
LLESDREALVDRFSKGPVQGPLQRLSLVIDRVELRRVMIEVPLGPAIHD